MDTIALKIAIVGLVINATTESGEVFDWWKIMVFKVTKNEKIHKMLYACAKCVAGQLAFWSSFYFLGYNNLIENILFVSEAIFFAIGIELIMNKIKR